MEKINSKTLYFKAILFSVSLYLILLIGICKSLGFGYKSAYSLYSIGTIGYFVKSLFIYLPLLSTSKSYRMDSTKKRIFLFVLPFLVLVWWFLFIIGFKISALYFDLSYGYISRFPHYFVQLFTTLLISALLFVRTNNKLKNENNI